ncbi:DEAD/DEAH box helicase [Clostridium sp. UBA7339]|uniref:DEAD/DEAH box helicase n=1 Tax=Clostridium sp. UBA7339 TaxID=1946376 RepID=UPI0032174702
MLDGLKKSLGTSRGERMSFIEDVTLDKVKSVITFRGKSDLLKSDDISDIQEKGTCALINILQKSPVAYLADEVGMGKTYQALAVATMVLNDNPKAKILIIVSKENIQDNWERDFDKFRSNNIIEPFDSKAVVMKKYNRPIDFIEDYLNREKRSLSLMRLTSFSAVLRSICKSNDNGKYYFENLIKGLKEKNLIKDVDHKNLNYRELTPKQVADYYGYVINQSVENFDLVIIDEAQNIRNENIATTFLNSMLGLSQNFSDEKMLKYCFKNRRCIANKTLLLSATPAHRSLNDIHSQFKYFNLDEEKIDRKFLEKYMVRRLRTYGELTKYDCRESKAEDLNDIMNVDQKLLVALIQKKLVLELDKNQKKDNKASYKIGFLETFESFDPSNTSSLSDNNDEDNEYENDIQKDFENGDENKSSLGTIAPDKVVMEELSKSYRKRFKDESNYPPHPKLDYMEKELHKLIRVDNDESEKALVFVRRIASVNELEKRLNTKYEESIIEYWNRILKKRSVNGIKKYFETGYKNKINGKNDVDDDIEEDEEVAVSEDSNKDEGKGDLSKWLAIKKENVKNESSVSKFRKSLTLNNTRTWIFEENYIKTICKTKNINYSNELKKIVDKDFISEYKRYLESNYDFFYKNTKNNALKPSVTFFLLNNLALKRICKKYPSYKNLYDFHTKFYSIDKLSFKENSDKKVSVTKKDIIKRLNHGSIWNEIMKSDRYKFLKEFKSQDDFKKREVLKIWISKFIRNSEMILDLLYYYVTNDSEDYYKKFSKYLIDKHSRNTFRFDKLIENYEQIRRNLIKNDEYETFEAINYKDFKATLFDKQTRVVGAVGGKNNNLTIQRFNTPFYPDVVICTDVFKEGINLHMFCSKVYQYGFAWTPGDLEQRIGRVDRYFSKTHREINKGNKDAKVIIHYPYMGNTIDEQQLKTVLKFKIQIDPLLDFKERAQGDCKDINLEVIDHNTVEELVNYKPGDSERDKMPYSGIEYIK